MGACCEESRKPHEGLSGVTVRTQPLVDVTSTTHRLVGEVRSQPALRALDRLSLALGVVRDLIFSDPSYREVPRLGIRKVQTADAGGRRHRGMFGQIDAERARVEQIEQRELLAVIRARRIAEGGPDAAVPFRD